MTTKKVKKKPKPCNCGEENKRRALENGSNTYYICRECLIKKFPRETA